MINAHCLPGKQDKAKLVRLNPAQAGQGNVTGGCEFFKKNESHIDSLLASSVTIYSELIESNICKVREKVLLQFLFLKTSQSTQVTLTCTLIQKHYIQL